MDRLEQYLEMGAKLGLAESGLQEYVLKLQAEERDVRAYEREARAREEERKTKEEERKTKEEERKFKLQELELSRQKLAMELEMQSQRRQEAEQSFQRQKELISLQGHVSMDTGTHGSQASQEARGSGSHYIPKLPPFDEQKDDIDAYIMRYETFARSQRWAEERWAVGLSALLKGEALSVYSRLAPDQALDYKELKEALLRRFKFTEEGFHKKFRHSRVEHSETVGQFASRLGNYLDRWLELAKCEQTYADLRDMMIREQVLLCCNQELTLFLRERAPDSVKALVNLADKFVEARGGVAKPFLQQRSTGRSQDNSNQHRNQASQPSKGSDRLNNNMSTKRQNNPANPRTCFICGSSDHLMAKCPRKQKSGVGAVTKMHHRRVDRDKGDNSSRDTGNTENLLSESVSSHQSGVPMPVLPGFVNGREVKVLRDTGCCGIVVQRQLVKDSQLLDMTQTLRLVDGTERQVPVANVVVHTPYFSGVTNVWCMDNPLYSVIIGNVPGAEPPDKPNKNFDQPSTVAAVETRAQKQKETVLRKTQLRVAPSLKDVATHEELKKEQQQDKTLMKLRTWANSNHTKEEKGVKTRFVVSKDLLYRELEEKGSTRRQLVVPRKFRETVLNLGHNSVMAGHLGIAKTTNRVLAEFFWPGCRSDIRRYCRSCDVCQRTVHKGSVRKVPLGDMPIIDKPFDKVAVDIVGPLYPASDRGHRYILTVVDCATRYPDAVPLKHIETEDIAEALVDVFSRVGVPREILSDRGSQFTSGVMKELSRLLSMRQMTTTPYHPASNGLVEKFNGTLKQMMKRMCVEQPRNWDKYINPVLFAYREVPQESLGFAPFELIYGHSVRGPLKILRELWTKDIQDPDVKSTYQYVVDLRDRLEKTCELAHENLKVAKFKQARNYNKHARDRRMQAGDQVLVLRPIKHNKLQLQWMGPYKIVSRVGDVDYQIDMSGKLKTFHANMLKQYHSRVAEATPAGVFECASIAVIEETYEDSRDGRMDRNEENPLLLPNVDSTETVSDVHISDDLARDQRTQILELLEQHKDVLTDLPGRTSLATHDIVTTTSVPVRVKPYPTPLHTRETIKEEVDKMLAMDIIEPSDSEYSSPIVMIRKRDSTWRFCIDYRQLNKITVFDAEPMPSPDDLFAKLSQCKYFSKFDLSKGYWQVPLSPDAKKKSAFTTSFGLFQFKVMSFGLQNAPSTFSRLMRKLLSGMQHIDNFLDDILIFTKTWEEHVRVLRTLCERLRDANLTARPSKCFVGFHSLECLGHIVGEDKLQPTPEKIAAIQAAARPTTKKQVRSFIGLANYYRKFIPNFATIAVPLTDLTKKGMPNHVQWTDAQENAFVSLKKHLTSTPILRLPDLEKTFTLRTDASDLGIGAILLQDTDDEMHPIAYASRKLLPRERRYSVMEKECLAMVWGTDKFAQYLLGREFQVETDHQPLTCLSNKKVANSRIMRWALLLQPFRMKIKAIPGCENVGADFLSRV
ncbi:uncharacterized protein LOC117340982 [Pecten maximus]|uniref:uncharacterized protein LOC117340982 n=1 Tax=Pecten maximus TaxID=6579 RepID=UPI0014586742|nr:uncharacterized protein LOC117340982 [Pecten maximus]